VTCGKPEIEVVNLFGRVLRGRSGHPYVVREDVRVEECQAGGDQFPMSTAVRTLARLARDAWSSPDLVETLPGGALATVDADEGTLVMFVDEKYELRTVEVGPRQWVLGCLVPSVDAERFKVLCQQLREASPGAVIRCQYQGGSFFLSAVRDPSYFEGWDRRAVGVRSLTRVPEGTPG
jgi:hypothetical protein